MKKEHDKLEYWETPIINIKAASCRTSIRSLLSIINNNKTSIQ